MTHHPSPQTNSFASPPPSRKAPSIPGRGHLGRSDDARADPGSAGRAFGPRPERGVSAEVEGHSVAVGNVRMMEERGYPLNGLLSGVERLQAEGKTAMLVAVDGAVRGVIAVADTLKDAVPLRPSPICGLGLEVIMLTGDNRQTAEAIAKQAGIERVLAEVLLKAKPPPSSEQQTPAEAPKPPPSWRW